MFTLRFNINKSVESLEYFTQEFKRQVLLNVYDKYWKEFVVHILSDLSDEEVSNLKSDFLNLSHEIKEIILVRLKNCTLPINVKDTTDTMSDKHTMQHSSKHTNFTNKESKIGPNDPCPCGSGKKFCECHGSSIRRNTRRRR